MGRGSANTMSEKKSIKTILSKSVKAFNSIFHKKKDGFDKAERKTEEQSDIEKVTKALDAVKIETKEDNDDLNDFTATLVEREEDKYIPREERKTARTDSQSSTATVDSGYHEKNDDDKRDPIEEDETEDDIKDNDEKDKAKKDDKKTRNVCLARAPIRTTRTIETGPYSVSNSQNRQTTTTNFAHLSGGGLIAPAESDLNHFPSNRVETLDNVLGYQNNNLQYTPEFLFDFPSNQNPTDVFSQDNNAAQINKEEVATDELLKMLTPYEIDMIFNAVDRCEKLPETENATASNTSWNQEENAYGYQNQIPYTQQQEVPDNRPQEFLSEASSNLYSPVSIDVASPSQLQQNYETDMLGFDTHLLLNDIMPDLTTEVPKILYQNADATFSQSVPDIFDTPPRSNQGGFSPNFQHYNVESPKSDISGLSSSRSPLGASESAIDIPHHTPPRSSPLQPSPSLERNIRNLTQYKHMKEALVKDLEKKYGSSKRESCRVVFESLTKDLTKEQRIKLCKNLSQLSIETVYTVLVHVLYNLSTKDTISPVLQKDESSPPELQYQLFLLSCDMILDKKPEWFLEDRGHQLLATASLCCSDKPILTRYIRECMNQKKPEQSSNSPIFSEVDRNGDNLIMALVRKGDACADVLYEIVRREDGRPPLFDINYRNPEGYSALHVACMMEEPPLHIVHLLLSHAKADARLGDVKGNDISLHVAVNKSNSNLELVLLLFSNTPRDQWVTLAKCKNLSNKTPMEYAKVIAKNPGSSATSKEIFNFLNKIRPQKKKGEDDESKEDMYH